MAMVAVGLALCAVLLWLPGLVLLGWLAPHLPQVARIAIAPALSYGVLYALASYLDLVGVPVRWQTVGLPVVLAAVAGAVVLGRRRGWRSPRPRGEHVALLVAVAVAYALWWWAVRSTATVPTYDDGANAGIFTYRIGALATIAPDRIIATDLGDGAGGVAFYPLALHLVAAVVVALTGLEPGAALHLQVATVAAVALPAGGFALARTLVRSGRMPGVRPAVAAGAAALVLAALPGLPWGQLPWGALAMVSGIALMPAVLLLVLDLPVHGVRSGALLGVAVAGLFAVHSSEVATCAVLGLAVVVACCGRSLRAWRSALGGAGVAVGTLLLFLGPVLRLLGGGLAERAAGTPGPPEAPRDALAHGWSSLLVAPRMSDVWGDRQLMLAWALTVLLVVGVIVARRTRAVVALVLASGLLGALAWWCLIGSELAHRIGTPWYANGYRLLATLTVPVGVVIGIGTAALLRPVLIRAVATVSAIAVLVLAVATSAVIGERTYAAYSPETASDRDAYLWLAARVAPGERVLNDSHDGSMWMYPLAGVAPVFGPKSDLWYTPAWEDRWYLLQHAAALRHDGHARAVADQLRVRYAFVGERLVFGEPRQLQRAELDASTAWREVYRSGSAVVFERVV